ncbi:Gfo/Idh/MocA family protein [Planctomicrobium sp. SH668]|uniref:Gfo/Idh/MocA family protein n=1 Tax=Planctomicrobium sp. SH668 TaxID=3448126 RepID=UPI003F5C42D8
MSNIVRVGLIGAGENTRVRHIPGLKSVSEVQIVAVSNRTAESSRQVADEFAIPKIYDTWQELLKDPEIDAVVIGTWPDTHCEISCAALEAGKHVLTEARMARNLAEAKQMLATSRKFPKQVAQIVPSPYGLVCGPAVDHLLKNHYLGDLREVVVTGATDQFWDYSKPLHWRQCAKVSGNNILSLGILHETLLRWAPQAVQVFAMTELFEPTRPLPNENRFAEVTVPDSVQILAELQGGARAIYHISGVTLLGPGTSIHLYGSRGTIKVQFVDGQEVMYIGRSEDKELSKLDIPEEEKGKWQVEEDFIAAIRGEKKVTLNDFATGVRYMEFLEAVAISANENAPVALPLED